VRGVHNTFFATLENDLKMLRYIDRNNAKKSAITLLKNHSSTASELGYAVQEVPVTERGKRGMAKYGYIEGGQWEVNGFRGRYEIVKVREGGDVKAYRVSKDIADSINQNPKEAGQILRFLGKSASVFRNLFTQKNPAFWVWNVQRDFRSFHRNIAQGSVIDKWNMWWAARKEIAQYLKTGEMTDDLRNALKERAMLSRSAYSDEKLFSRWDKDFEKSLEGMTENAQLRRISGWTKGVLNWLDNMNDMMELSTKLAGYKVLSDDSGVSARQRAELVRTRIGTPDVHAGGTLTPWTNKLFLFSNMQIQGMRQSLKVMRENPKRSLAMWAIDDVAMPGNGVLWPILAQHGLLSAFTGLFGDYGWDDEFAESVEDAYNRIPSYDKIMRAAIPFPGLQTEDGKQFYIVLPRSEMGSLVSGITYNIVNGIVSVAKGDGEEALESYKDIIGAGINAAFPYAAERFLPLAQAGYTVGSAIGGQNPTDFHKLAKGYINPRVIRNNADPLEATWDVTRTTLDKLGANVVWRIPERDFQEALWSEDEHWFENLLGQPIIGNPLGRFVRVSNRGLEE
jgi:hypothetical protein